MGRLGPYADAYKASGGTITSLSFLAALVSCPAYVLQIASIYLLNRRTNRIRSTLGLVFATIFAILAGLNYVVQLVVVRVGMLTGKTEGLVWLVFQNPNSLMLGVDFVGWFFLGLAFLSVASFFNAGKVGRAIRYLLAASGTVGVALLAGYVTSNPAIGQIFLSMMSALLICADALLLVYFRRLLKVRPA